jgi:MSHA biogenesis protein MshK
MNFGVRRTCLLAGAALILAASHWAAAETLRDPTRPADAEPIRGSGGVAAGPQLQSILIAPGRKVAVISGQTVKLGDTYGDARVVALTDSQVTLQRGDEKQVLKLFSGVEKHFASKADSTSKTRPASPTQFQRQ